MRTRTPLTIVFSLAALTLLAQGTGCAGRQAKCGGAAGERARAQKAAEAADAAEAAPADAQAAEASVRALFDAMRNKDCAAMRARVEPGARIYRLSGEAELAVISDEDFVQGVCAGEAVIDERVSGPVQATVSGDLASLWIPYEVYVDSSFQHSGIDAVHLRRDAAGEWKVTAISYTQS